MKSGIGHIVFHIDTVNIPFYKELLTFLGWAVWYDDPAMLGMGNEQGASLWFGNPIKQVINDYDGPGMNHLGISVEKQTDVDQVVEYLEQHGVAALFETPRHRPEFSGGPEMTYYQVMFETPDRILLEVVYTGPKS
jgi:catechol 2,3-dioxygenase-like lactoylglutathione lyase family enzyme